MLKRSSIDLLLGEYYIVDVKKVEGPWNPVLSKALKILLNNLYKRSQVVCDGEEYLEIIAKNDLETAFAISGFPFYEGEEIPFDYSEKHKAFLMHDVFYVLDDNLEANVKDTYCSTALCWAKKPAEDGEDGLCLGPAEALINPELSKKLMHNKTRANIPELTREESLLTLKNMILSSDHFYAEDIEFLLELDIPETIIEILLNQALYVIPDDTLILKGTVSDEFYEKCCTEDLGLSTETLLLEVLKAL